MASQTIVGPGLQFTQDNRRCYAYSGEVAVANTELDLLVFETNSEYISAEVQLGSRAAENEDYEFRIYFNDIVVFSATFGNQSQNEIGSWPIPLIIPPHINVKMSLDNIADTDSRVWTVHLIGRVYEYLPVRN